MVVPRPWLAIELKRPVQLVHPLSHIDQPQPSGVSVAAKTNAIIEHRKTNVTIGPAKPNFRPLRLRMFRHIAEGFLGDAVRGQRATRDKSAIVSSTSHETGMPRTLLNSSQ